MTKRGILPRKKSQHHGRPAQIPYGTRKVKDQLLENMTEKRVVNAIVDMHEEGMSLRAIARFLSQIKVPTKNRGKKWHPEMVSRILKRGGVKPESSSVNINQCSDLTLSLSK